ncbi:hypothetical protein IQ06DRAFT_209516 [Phaeosphaeriaceae sp. SRC1lsM3a]|nr:hypothetical protein IQ06DRAFT_209516 [Stagonospora sp. SRC1lsM3a]
MTTPEERKRARAELMSYIARLKKDKQDRESQLANGFADQNSVPPKSPYRHHTSNGCAENYGANDGQPAARGGRGRGRGGAFAYHPYQRPYAAQRFRNRSATFNNTESDGENLDESSLNNTPPGQGARQHTEPKTLCPAFTSTGICSRHGCRRLHDPEKQAICKRYLFKGECPKGAACPLSHQASAHNAPTCQHFQEGRCTNDDCRFSHVKVNAAAPNCESFGVLGYCEKGDACPDLHAHECPHFSNTGACLYGDNCRLGHVRRASRMRTATRPSSEGAPSREDSPKKQPDDSADAETFVGGAAEQPHQFSQQVDFVALNTDD